MKQSTLALVQTLKENLQDFEWYPSNQEHIDIVTNDIAKINVNFDITSRYSDPVKVLDVGAGDGRVLKAIEAAFSEKGGISISPLAIEKASVHTSTYRSKGITLLGTDFNEINFLSKHCNICFVNPPYSVFSAWLSRLISQLNFTLLYAIVPERWQDDPAIQEAIKLRGLKYTKVLAQSDFINADRSARAKVHIIRFSFDDLNPDSIRKFETHYKPTLGRNTTDPFQQFIEIELGLKQTYSDTTLRFSEHAEKQRIKAEMETEGTPKHEVMVSKGVLWALLNSYEQDLQKTLEQYKLIGQLNPQLLKELGIKYESILEAVKEKLLGYRNVYWSLLFEHLDALSSRLTGKHKASLLNKLSSNALDFTYLNALYVINYAIEMANELIEQSLVDVFLDLTSTDAILRHYKSNERLYRDDWRHTREPQEGVKYLLDYRFIHSSWTNFSSHSWEQGLVEGARVFTNDLMVALKLLGYNNLYVTDNYKNVQAGGKLSIMGDDLSGDTLELVHIKYYKNGNRHLKFNQEAMLRFNVTVSRVLGWVRSKEEFAEEADTGSRVPEGIWVISDDMKIRSNHIPMLTNLKAA